MIVKPRLIRTYENLPLALKEQCKLVFPKGFSKHLRSYQRLGGDYGLGLYFETETIVYIISMTNPQAEKIIQNDEDFEENGCLKPRRKEYYSNIYKHLNYLAKYNRNIDNNFQEVQTR